MSTRIHLYSGLSNFTEGQNLVEVSGKTVGECLKNLVCQYPQLKEVLFDPTGKLFRHVFVSINLNSANPEQLDQPINPSDELYIIQITAGG